MNPQLDPLARELRELSQRVRRLAAETSEDTWTRRPEPERWSAAENVRHLSITTKVYLPTLRPVVENPRAPRLPAGGKLRGDVTGSLLKWMMEPPVRIRLKTTAAFIPGAAAPKQEVVAEFERLQSDLIALIERAGGLDLGKIRLTSPFNARIKYNAYSAFQILAAHQRRHLWLAERLAR